MHNEEGINSVGTGKGHSLSLTLQ